MDMFKCGCAVFLFEIHSAKSKNAKTYNYTFSTKMWSVGVTLII